MPSGLQPGTCDGGGEGKAEPRGLPSPRWGGVGGGVKEQGKSPMQGRAGSASVPTIGFTVLRFRNDEVRDARNGAMFEVLAVPGAIEKPQRNG